MEFEREFRTKYLANDALRATIRTKQVNEKKSMSVQLPKERKFWLNDDRILITLFAIICYLLFLQDISYLMLTRTITLLLFLLFIPGWALLRLLGFEKIGKIEILFLSVGLSIFAVTMIGLSINFLPIQRPLRPEISFTAITIVVLSIIWGKKRSPWKPLSTISRNITKLKIWSLTFILLSVCLISATIIGVEMLNHGDSNSLVVTIPAVLACYIVFSALLLRRQNDEHLISVSLYTISLCLLFIYSLRSSHVMGADVHLEMYVFNKVANSLYWNFWSEYYLFTAPYMGCLSITLYPTILSTISKVGGEALFKILYPSLLSLTPVITYHAFREKLAGIPAYATAVFFILHDNYIAESHAMQRMLLSLFFYTLLIYVIMKWHGRNRIVLASIFIFGLITSHYASTYVAAFILVAGYAIFCILQKLLRVSSRPTHLRYVSLIMIVGTFFWFDQFIETGVFGTVTKIVYEAVASGGLFITGMNLRLQVYTYPSPLNFWSRLALDFSFYYGILLQILILLGFISVWLSLRKNYDEKILELFSLAVASLSVAALNIIFGTDVAMGIYRIYQISVLLLSPILVFGFYYTTNILLKLFGYKVSVNIFKDNIVGIILVILLVGQLLITSGFLWQASGFNKGIYMNDFDTAAQYGYAGGVGAYITNEEIIAAKWVAKNHGKFTIYSDVYGVLRLYNYGGVNTSEGDVKYLDSRWPTVWKCYLYLRYEVVKYNRIPISYYEANELRYVSLDSLRMINSTVVFEAGDVKVLWVDVLTIPTT